MVLAVKNKQNKTKNERRGVTRPDRPGGGARLIKCPDFPGGQFGLRWVPPSKTGTPSKTHQF